jgi:hypothetical protein
MIQMMNAAILAKVNHIKANRYICYA